MYKNTFFNIFIFFLPHQIIVFFQESLLSFIFNFLFLILHIFLYFSIVILSFIMLTFFSLLFFFFFLHSSVEFRSSRFSSFHLPVLFVYLLDFQQSISFLYELLLLYILILKIFFFNSFIF